MAVSAIELRPRGPVALLDAAIRLCARSSGPWALTLPGGALVTAALLHLLDSMQRGGDLLLPSALFTAAWFSRGVLQGAACHYVDRLLLGSQEPTAVEALSAALRRLPSLFVAVAYLACLNLFGLTFTLGLYLFLFAAQGVGYAVAMQGKGHPLALYGTCSKLLGRSRSSALWVRLLFAVQLLLMVNLHFGTNVLLYLAQKVIGVEVTFAQRFASLDNGVWLIAVGAIAFTLLEPLRAAAATLLLIDGRVRHEGLDLLAAIEQLPTRREKRTPAAARTAAILLVAGALLPSIARADDSSRARLQQVVEACELEGPALDKQLQAVGELTGKERSALSRLVAEIERYAYDDGDCELVADRLDRALPLIVQTRDALKSQPDAAEDRERAQRILLRPEFARAPEPGPKAEAPDEPEGFLARLSKWWDELWLKFWRWLQRSGEDDRDRTPVLPSSGGGAVMAHGVVIVLVAAVLVGLVALLVRGWSRRNAGGAEIDVERMAETPLASDPMSALSRPPEGWAHLADELAAKGDYREAVRSLYLALLSRLHREGAIDYDPTRSNWDYFRGFKGPRDWVPPFRELTRRFDFTYYGNLGATSEGYHQFRELSRPLLSPAPALPETAHA